LSLFEIIVASSKEDLPQEVSQGDVAAPLKCKEDALLDKLRLTICQSFIEAS
jgi:hypothetical protein